LSDQQQQQQARILIAEDEANLRLVLQKELERLGYRVQAAPDGEAALRKLEESNVDVLLCDINMPRIDGMELLRRVHQRPNPPEVIMLTGQATVETAVEAMKLGAYDYLPHQTLHYLRTRHTRQTSCGQAASARR
jgi:DNA-binding NtrC family response regulator